MLYLARRHWFLFMLAAVLATGLSLPYWIDESTLAQTRRFPRDSLLSATMFFMALPLEMALIYHAVRRPQAVLLGVAINSGLLPLFAWLVSITLRPDLAMGLLVAGSIPSTLASAAVWTRHAGGNDAVSALVTLITNLTCFVVTPFWLTVTTGTELKNQIDGLQMALELLVVVVAPMLLGQLVRLYRPLADWATRHKPALSLVAQWGILAMVFVAAIEAGVKLYSGESQIGPLNWFAMIASVVVAHTTMLAAGHVLGAAIRLSRADRIAVGFSGSQKTLMIGVNTALETFGGLAMFPMVTYHVFQLLIDAVVAERLRNRGPAHETAVASRPQPDQQLDELAAVDETASDAG
jgi:sodium/bile acid cotransporter 7